MEQTTIYQTINQLGKWLEEGGYSKNTIYQFKSTTNQLIKFMESKGIQEFNTTTGLAFLQEQYSIDPGKSKGSINYVRYGFMRKLSDFQLHGIPQFRNRRRTYVVPENFCEATEAFTAYRRFEGIIEKNMSTVSLYLERFFSYLTAQSVTLIPRIETRHIHGYLRFIMGFSNQSRNHMMRTVRQFLGFCFKNGYHPKDLSLHTPVVHYDKRARIPSAYSQDDVLKLLST